MAEILHQLRLVVYPHYLQGFKNIQPVVGLGISEPSTICLNKKRAGTTSRTWRCDSLIRCASRTLKTRKEFCKADTLAAASPRNVDESMGFKTWPKKHEEKPTNWEIFGKQNFHKLQLPGVRKTPKFKRFQVNLHLKSAFQMQVVIKLLPSTPPFFFQKNISDSAAQTFAIFSVCKPATIKDLSGEISILWSEASSKKHWGLWEDRPWRLASWCLRWLTWWTPQVLPPWN